MYLVEDTVGLCGLSITYSTENSSPLPALLRMGRDAEYHHHT